MTDPALDTAPLDDLWTAAREAYLAGATGHTVCRDLDIAPSTFWKRAAREGWLKRDRKAPAAEPLDMDAPPDHPALAADKAWRRVCQALDRGQAAEAQRWIKLHALLETEAFNRRAADRYEASKALRLAGKGDGAAMARAPLRPADGGSQRPMVEKVESVSPDSPEIGPDRVLNRPFRPTQQP